VNVNVTVNGKHFTCAIDPETRLLDLLRDTLHLTGTKEGCGEGECGACTVLLDGRPVNSCLVLAAQAEGASVETIEGLASATGMHPVQQAFVDAGGVQCGFCTPGFVMSTVALLRRTLQPTEEEILTALEGNLCRCTGYANILKAVRLAAERMQEGTG